MAIRAVAFDMDGLLFNTEHLYDHVALEIVSKRGHQIELDLIRRMMGQPARVALRLMIDHYGFDDTPEQLQEETDDIFARILPSQLATMPGAIELLQRLAENATPMALTTSSGTSAVERLMTRIDLRSYFGFRLTAEDVQHGKPHPEMYIKAAERFEVAPHEMLVLEDSENGCRAGVDAGACVVAIPSKHVELHDFTGAHFVADSLLDARLHDLLFD